MSRLKYLLVLVAVVLTPGLALAQAPPTQAPRWGYIEAGYMDFSPDEGDSDNGAYAGGSFNLGKHFHLLAEYDDVGNYTFWNAGFGWHGLFGEKADLYAQALWANIDAADFDINENGTEFQAGVRWQLIRWFELKMQANWVDYGGDLSSDTTGEVGALFLFLKGKMGVGAEWIGGGDADTTRAYFRFNFGK